MRASFRTQTLLRGRVAVSSRPTAPPTPPAEAEHHDRACAPRLRGRPLCPERPPGRADPRTWCTCSAVAPENAGTGPKVLRMRVMPSPYLSQ